MFLRRMTVHARPEYAFINAEHLEAHKEMMQCWSDYPDMCQETYVPLYIRGRKKVAGYSRTIHQE